MKTTVDIADALFEEARVLAAKEGVTLRALVEEGLRKVVLDHSHPRTFKLQDGSFQGGEGVQAGIDLANWEQIRDMIYEGRGA